MLAGEAAGTVAVRGDRDRRRPSAPAFRLLAGGAGSGKNQTLLLKRGLAKHTQGSGLDQSPTLALRQKLEEMRGARRRAWGSSIQCALCAPGSRPKHLDFTPWAPHPRVFSASACTFQGVELSRGKAWLNRGKTGSEAPLSEYSA